MEELIKQIMSIEDKAQSIVRDAKEASSELEERLTRDVLKMRSAIEQKAKERGESLKEKLRENKDKWAAEIAERVINA